MDTEIDTLTEQTTNARAARLAAAISNRAHANRWQHIPEGERQYYNKPVPSRSSDQLAAEARAILPGAVNGIGGELRRLILSPAAGGKERRRLSGRLDTRRLVPAIAGAQDAFTKRWRVEGEDTAVSLLVDLSGSMQGAKAVFAGLAAYALAKQLHRSSAEFEVIGFTDTLSERHDTSTKRSIESRYLKEAPTSTNEQVALPKKRRSRLARYHDSVGLGNGSSLNESVALVPFKTYEQKIGQCEKALLYGIPAFIAAFAGGTPDYEAVLAACARLCERDVQRRVLIVFTDGCGAGHDAIRHACKLAGLRGVDVIGIGIQDYSVSCFPHHIVVNQLTDLCGAALRKVVDVVTKERAKRGDA